VNVQSVQMFVALLAVAAILGTVVLLLSHLLAGRVALADAILDQVRDAGLWLVFTLTGTSMLGSLYFSEVAHYAPCKLCWYQRIAMYSLAIVFLVAAIRKDKAIAPYGITLAAIGSAISVYHYLVEWFPTLESNVCAVDVPCTTVWFRRFGFVSLPFMALCAFVSSIVVLITLMRSPHH